MKINSLPNIIPKIFKSYENFCILIATKNWHKPSFYLSTLFFAPLGLYLWEKKIEKWYLRIPARTISYLFFFLAILVFFKGGFIALALLPIARILRFFWYFFKIDKGEEVLLGKSMRFKFEKLDFLSLAFIFFVFFSFLANSEKFYPFDDDVWYHMAVAKAIIEKGIPLWDWWDFQPIGRPHLYPPLFHLLIVFFSDGNVFQGIKALQTLLYPVSLSTSWYFARWLTSAKHGFLALLVLSMDASYILINYGTLSSSLVNLLLPLLLLTFLTKRLKLTIILLTAILYTHLSIPIATVICLFILSHKYPAYKKFFRKALLVSFILYLPWLLRVLLFKDWLRTFATGLGNPLIGLLIGLLSLQIINPIFIFLGIKGVRTEKPPNLDVVKYVLIGFLPVLLFYGGRYWMHTVPFWSIFISYRLLKYLNSRKRVLVFLLISLIPLPLITFGMPENPAPGFFPSITATDVSLFLYTHKPEKDEDFEKVVLFVLENTVPEEIISVDNNALADKIFVYTGRRVDSGMFWEAGTFQMQQQIEVFRKKYARIFIYLDKSLIPKDCKIFNIGKYWIGVRG